VSAAPIVDVVIVNWNTSALTRALLATLAPLAEQESRVRVIVVDNGSTDGSADAVAAAFPWVVLVRSASNLGYARGNNLGLAHGHAPYVWLLNSDTEVRDLESPSRLLAYLESHPECAAVGPALVLPGGALQTGAAGHDIGLLSAFHYCFFLSRLLPRVCRGYFIDQRAWLGRTEGARVDWVCGAAMMVRRSALERVGQVPTDNFMYAEDVTLCRKLRQQGHDVVYLPSATILHHHGASSHRAGAEVSARWIQSVLDEYGARVGPVRRAAMKAIFAGGFLLRGLLYLLFGALAPSASALAKSRAMWTYGAASLRHRYRTLGEA
jgi:GT2 family glycosyltransferase